MEGRLPHARLERAAGIYVGALWSGGYALRRGVLTEYCTPAHALTAERPPVGLLHAHTRLFANGGPRRKIEPRKGLFRQFPATVQLISLPTMRESGRRWYH